ncbi:MAG: FAD-containing oxidoreductase [Alphaproteobacteria bacterium]|nr:FAD-containing oxidoreductase [Alphaproteobacteria bacterium]
MPNTFDAIVIGTGQAGPPLAARLAGEGFKTAIVERRLVGGTCVNTGCVPTKALIASARAAHVARRAADFGISLKGKVAADMGQVKARKDAIVAKSRLGTAKWMTTTENLTLIRGHARFTGPKTIAVKGETLTAERLFIDVGARAYVPEMPGIAEIPYLTNASMMDVDRLPRHLAIAGGSYIGLEFAQMYRRFGAEVTVIERGDRLIAREDPDISEEVRRILADEGVNFRLNAACISFATRRGGVAVGLDCKEKAKRVEASHVLLALGRVPNTHDLGLDKAGIETDKRGFIKVGDDLRTSVDGVWALGECNGRGAFTHTAYNDYEIVAANLLDGGGRKVTDRIPAYALYVDPPLGRCGMSEAEARASGRKVLKATLKMSRVGRARERSETDGFMKILVDAESRQILGAALLGIEGDEVMQTLLSLMYAKAPVSVIESGMYVHPTVSEYLPTLVGALEPLE